MHKLRVVVATPDQELQTRTSELLAERGHLVVKRCQTAIEALEACFEEVVDLAVVDEDLPSISGSHIAEIVRDLRYPVSIVVMMRGPLDAGPDITTVDPSDGRFEAALLRVTDGLAPRRDAG